MAKTAAQLRKEILQTRQAMTRTVDELSGRVETTRRQISVAEHMRQRPFTIASGVAVVGLCLGLLRGRRH